MVLGLPVLQRVELTERFQRDYKKLNPHLQARVKHIIEHELMPWPARRALRHHPLNDRKFTVTSNHSHQITFECDGTTARLLRVGMHSQIDRDPGD